MTGVGTGQAEFCKAMTLHLSKNHTYEDLGGEHFRLREQQIFPEVSRNQFSVFKKQEESTGLSSVCWEKVGDNGSWDLKRSCWTSLDMVNKCFLILSVVESKGIVLWSDTLFLKGPICVENGP